MQSRGDLSARTRFASKRATATDAALSAVILRACASQRECVRLGFTDAIKYGREQQPRVNFCALRRGLTRHRVSSKLQANSLKTHVRRHRQVSQDFEAEVAHKLRYPRNEIRGADHGSRITNYESRITEINRNTVALDFRSIPFKTNEADPHKAKQIFMAGLPVSSAKTEGGRVWEIVLRAPRALPGGARADGKTSGNRCALRAIDFHSSLAAWHSPLASEFLIDTQAIRNALKSNRLNAELISNRHRSGGGEPPVGRAVESKNSNLPRCPSFAPQGKKSRRHIEIVSGTSRESRVSAGGSAQGRRGWH